MKFTDRDVLLHTGLPAPALVLGVPLIYSERASPGASGFVSFYVHWPRDPLFNVFFHEHILYTGCPCKKGLAKSLVAQDESS